MKINILLYIFLVVSTVAWAGGATGNSAGGLGQVAALPIVTDFSEGKMEGWTEFSRGSWTFDEFGGYVQGEPGGMNNALVSSGFEACGTVRVKISYGASAWGEGAMRVAVLKEGSEDVENIENVDNIENIEGARESRGHSGRFMRIGASLGRGRRSLSLRWRRLGFSG